MSDQLVKTQSGLNSSPSGSGTNVICIHEKSLADSLSTAEKMLGASWSAEHRVWRFLTSTAETELSKVLVGYWRSDG
ncbi:hypothetical protein ACTXT7_004269 [Hymenolepis weldensis]